MMTNGDHEGLIFLSHTHTNNGFFFLPPLNTSFILGKTWQRLPENPEYAEMLHDDVILTLQFVTDRCAASVRLFFFIIP